MLGAQLERLVAGRERDPHPAGAARAEALAGRVSARSLISHHPSALVTGASRRAGIAAAVVEALRRGGWAVATTAWPAYDESEPRASRPEEAEEIGRGMFIGADLSNPDAPAQVLAAAEAIPDH
jgi:hypothetical protein